MDTIKSPEQNIYDTLTKEEREKQAKAALRIKSEHTLRSENLPFDIDVWYPIIKSFTFPSIFLPLKRKEARALINMYNTGCLGRHWLRPQDVVVLQDLENRIDSLLKTHFRETGAFLRLCGRSPKDADPLHPEEVYKRYQKELKRLVVREGYPESPNTKFIAFIRTNWMRVTNGAEAMSLLVTSERVHVDMDDWLRYGEPEQIVLREWEPELSMENEFRCFVHRNQLNAISQYDHYGVFPHLESIKEKIQEKILSSWKQVHPLIGEESYMIDYVYLPKSDRAVVVELSPFLTCTGPACFRWSNEQDRNILENGPFEFRLKLQTTVTEGLIVSGVEDRFKGGQRKYYDWYKTVPLPPKESIFQHYWQVFLLLAGLVATTWLPSPLPSSWEVSSPLPSWGLPVIGLVGWIFLFLKKAVTSTSKPYKHKIFFYGTLKRGFHWNQKFLSDSEFLTTAITCEPHPLVIGACGVPYLLDGRPGQGKNVRGEVWCVDDETLEAMDEYEGLRKGYYCRRKIMVRGEGERGLMEVEVYFKVKALETEFEDVVYEEEYTKEFHDQFYKPIRHIQIKQRSYLGIDYDMKN